MWQVNRPSFDPSDFPIKGSYARCCIFLPHPEYKTTTYSFHFARVRRPDLYLNDNGLLRYLETTITDINRPEDAMSEIELMIKEEMPSITIIHQESVNSVPLPARECEYRFVLDYALNRFPRIAEEIFRYLTQRQENNYPWKNPKERKRRIKKDWQDKQEQIMRQFYAMFCKSLVDSSLPKNIAQRLIRRASPLNQNAH